MKTFLSGRNVSRRSHHHILRRGTGANPAGSRQAGRDSAGGQDEEDQPQARSQNTFEEKVHF